MKSIWESIKKRKIKNIIHYDIYNNLLSDRFINIPIYRNNDTEDNKRKSGKGRIIHELMQSIGIPTFIDGYHIGWIWEEAE